MRKSLIGATSAGLLTLALGLSSTLFTAPPADATISPTTTDSDGDGPPDTWETQGVDTDGDGVIDLDLPALGADPRRADLFVELDYMKGLLPSSAELDRIRQSFAGLPVNNPDGSTGITIHLDAGPAGGAAYDLGGGNEIPYKQNLSGVSEVRQLRQTYSDPKRANVFHYAVFGDSYGTGSSSGQAWINGLELLVTVGPRYWGAASSDIRVGTFIHELGHNLGLHHGGTDEVNNKPNYLSIMNYAYQMSGIPQTAGDPYFGYSTRNVPTLDESSLTEGSGLGPAAAGSQLYWWTNGTRHQARADGPIDWNWSGTINPGAVQQDINNDKNVTTLAAPNDLQSFSLTVGSKGKPYSGRTLRSAEPPLVAETNELTHELARQLHPDKIPAR
ncbi:zinc-dependent metalloprotease family protein [Arthrobacter sp. NPDC090010]|uniref:zinc-dependent metalloprotease family protein n=1 Tax=Arthrobacter sp. NPDC090010 TaxID=3363942 RepID=UPI00380052CE